MHPLIYWSSIFALSCFVIGLVLSSYRLATGPTAADRVLALDTMYSMGLLALLALGIRFDSRLYFDMALLIGLFGFVGSAAMAKFLLRGEVIEP
ncbi:MAG TPA: K+/H+ antiporter subunit F [Candidatus Paenalcaligenes intestinipullorum]|uniref:K+/H+ antiporter subunit F n=1 Tax=Candidatus Paenalcaligenes intestinipullorum TaxID=2838718 RepID=A0A9D2U8T1_9BURK|nr:K+/H+ antiporter subunit F [Candidatus Paenalcaligenes intestinipullorum]